MKVSKVLSPLVASIVILTFCLNTSYRAAGMSVDVYEDFSIKGNVGIDIKDDPVVKVIQDTDEVEVVKMFGYWESCTEEGPEICFGDYYRLLPKDTFPNRAIVPDMIILHTDDQSGIKPHRWLSTTTYNGLSGEGLSVHFGVGLDGVTQYLPMYFDSVERSRGAGYWVYDRRSIQIEMAGRTYNYLVEGKASPEMEASIINITERTLDLVVALMITYDTPIENVIGHYHVTYSGKTDPGNLWLEEYFLPLLEERLEQESS